MKQNNHTSSTNFFSIAYWKDREMDLYLGKLLRFGVFSACFITLLGGILYMLSGQDMPDYKAVSGLHDTFTGVAPYLRKFSTILIAALHFDSAAIIQLGVIVLIATPILRVAFSALIFLIEHDYLYVVISLIVLGVILSNLFFGLR